MNKDSMKKLVLGISVLVGVVVLGVLLTSGEVENEEVVGSPPGIEIDTSYNATISGTPFYTVLQEDEDLFDNNLATCTDLGGESDRQEGWYSLVALEDGKTVKEVVFEQAQLEKGDNLIAVYYNSGDKTWESVPNRIIKGEGGVDLPLLNWNKTLKKGEVITVTSNRSVDFCKNYDESTGHENVVVGSWNLVSKPDFEKVGYRSIWTVDFSKVNLSQLYKEGDNGFDALAMSDDDLYWIYGGRVGGNNNGGGAESESSKYEVTRLIGSRFENGEIAETILYGDLTDGDISIGDSIELYCDNISVEGTVTRILPGDATQNTNLPDVSSASSGSSVTVFVSGVTPGQIDCSIPGQSSGNNSGSGTDNGDGQNSNDGSDNGGSQNGNGSDGGVDFDDDQYNTDIPVVAVSDVTVISGRGTVVQGEVISGTVREGEKVTLQCDSYSGEFDVREVQNQSGGSEANTGQEVAVLLSSSAADMINCENGNSIDNPAMADIQKFPNDANSFYGTAMAVFYDEVGRGFWAINENGEIFENFSKGNGEWSRLPGLSTINRPTIYGGQGDYVKDLTQFYVMASEVDGVKYSLISWVGKDNRFWRYEYSGNSVIDGNAVAVSKFGSEVQDSAMSTYLNTSTNEYEDVVYVAYDCVTTITDSVGFGARSKEFVSCNVQRMTNFGTRVGILGNDFLMEGDTYFASVNHVWGINSFNGWVDRFNPNTEEYKQITTAGNTNRSSVQELFFNNGNAYGINSNKQLYMWNDNADSWKEVDYVYSGGSTKLSDVEYLGGGLVYADSNEGQKRLYEVICSIYNNPDNTNSGCNRETEFGRAYRIDSAKAYATAKVEDRTLFTLDGDEDGVYQIANSSSGTRKFGIVKRINNPSAGRIIQTIPAGERVYLMMDSGGDRYLVNAQL